MSRVKLWGILLTCSVVSLVSALSVLEDRKEVDWARHEKWVVATASMSIAFSFFGLLSSFLPKETSSKIESPLITLAFGFWAATLPALMDPDNELAVGEGYGINNANLYFFGWGSLVSSIVLAGDFGKEMNDDVDSPVTLKWFLLGATGFTIMGTAAGLYKSENCKNGGVNSASDEYCRRTNFAVYFGLCSAVMSLIMVPFKTAPFQCHVLVSALMLPAWCCAVAFLTFGDGPGTGLGNIYFATWIGLFLCLNVVTTSVRRMQQKEGGEDMNKEGARSDGESNQEDEVGVEAPEKTADEEDPSKP